MLPYTSPNYSYRKSTYCSHGQLLSWKSEYMKLSPPWL
jgi:hypothetical protein